MPKNGELKLIGQLAQAQRCQRCPMCTKDGTVAVRQDEGEWKRMRCPTCGGWPWEAK